MPDAVNRVRDYITLLYFCFNCAKTEANLIGVVVIVIVIVASAAVLVFTIAFEQFIPYSFSSSLRNS